MRGMIALLDSVSSERERANEVIERLSAENEHLLSMLAAKGIGATALDSAAVLPVAVSLDAVERIKRDSSLFRSASLPSFIEPQEAQPEKQPLYDRLLGKFTR